MNKRSDLDEVRFTKMMSQSLTNPGSVLPGWNPPDATTLPITGLNTIAGDLAAQEATLRNRAMERSELDAKLEELVELIRQARHEVGLSPKK